MSLQKSLQKLYHTIKIKPIKINSNYYYIFILNNLSKYHYHRDIIESINYPNNN